MPIVVDLFAGAGGFSLGAEWAGFDVTHALEVDEWACDTLRRNHRDTLVLHRDIREISDAEFRREFPRNPELLIGGPPCQGFSHAAVGRQDPKDPRNSLFKEFVRAASVLEPEVVIMENVPGILRSKTAAGEPVSHLITSELERLGYEVTVLVLNAEEFGVPQIRRRVFFIALASGSAPVLVPTHGASDLFEDRRSVLSVRDAIGDLPLVDVGSTLEPVPYEVDPQNEFQTKMRAGAGRGVFNHVPMRHTKRLIERFKTIAPGQSQSHAPDDHAPKRRVRSEEQGTARYDQNNRRMHWDRPCHTIAATFYANFLHPELNRNFTPREGARIQTFPDNYVFMGKATTVSQKLLAREGRHAEKHLSQYVQIGNSVPPLLAQQVILASVAAGRSARIPA